MGLRAVAVPIRGQTGKIVCAIAVSRFNEDVSPQESSEMYLPPMLETAEKITSVIADVKEDWHSEHLTPIMAGGG